MVIAELGNKRALYEDEVRISPIIDNILPDRDMYHCHDHFNIKYFGNKQRVDIQFYIGKNGGLKGPIYNSYFNNVDYVDSLLCYEQYINNLKNRIYFSCMHEYFNKEKRIRKVIK